MDATLVATLATMAGAAAGAFFTWLRTRRTTSGRIGTSDADVLWKAAEHMRGELEAQRDKAVDQRDRLIDAQATQVLPALAAITDALNLITGALDRIERQQRQP